MLKNSKLNIKLNITLLAFLVAIVMLWAAFYLAAYSIIRSSTVKNVEQMAAQSILLLENAFLEIEHITFSVSQKSQIKAFVSQTDILDFYDMADEAEALISAATDQNDLVSGMLLYKSDGNYYRFIGMLSNALCDKAYYVINTKTPPCSFYIESGNTGYIGYASGIYKDDELIGYAVALIYEKSLARLLSTYRIQESIEFALLTDGMAIAAGNADFSGKAYDEIVSGVSIVKSVSVGMTPFQIVVIANEEQLTAVTRYFGISAAITVILIILVILTYSLFWRKHFLSPTLKIMQEVEEMGRGERQKLS
ncbi:MAG: hypothetical protein WC900_06575, partial [Oscillospiraceae bacterium]